MRTSPLLNGANAPTSRKDVALRRSAVSLQRVTDPFGFMSCYLLETNKTALIHRNALHRIFRQLRDHYPNAIVTKLLLVVERFKLV